MSSEQMHRDLYEAFRDDCDMLLKRFTLHASFSFKVFASVWREEKFSFVYLGNYTDYEIVHFTSLLYHCAKKYFLRSSCRLTQTGALYILYALYHKQPVKRATRIRIVSSELDSINEYAGYLRHRQHLEALYVLRRLLRDACEFTLAQHELTNPSPRVQPPEKKKTTHHNDHVDENCDLADLRRITRDTIASLAALEVNIGHRLQVYKDSLQSSPQQPQQYNHHHATHHHRELLMDSLSASLCDDNEGESHEASTAHVYDEIRACSSAESLVSLLPRSVSCDEGANTIRALRHRALQAETRSPRSLNRISGEQRARRN